MMGAVDLKRMAPGFENPPVDSRKTFRAILEAVSRPGKIVGAGSGLTRQPDLHPATCAAALTLFDFETKVWTDLHRDAPALGWMKFHCGAPFVEGPEAADYAVVTRPLEMPELMRFRQGTEREPHLSATLIIQPEFLVPDRGRKFSGPGIETVHLIDPSGVAEHFWESRKLSPAMFPMGVDVVFTCNDNIAAMPRTTTWEEICT